MVKPRINTTLSRLFGKVNDHVDLTALRSAKVWVVLGIISFALIVGGYHFGDRYGLLIGFLLAISINALVFFYDDLRLSSLFPTTEFEGRDPWGALRLTAEVSAQIGVRRPTVNKIETRTPTAFSTGIFASRHALYLSTGLLEKLSPDELRAILTYELLRMKSRQTRTATATAALAGLIVFLANAIDSTLFLQGFRQKAPGQIRPMAFLLSPLVGLFVRLAMTRRGIFQTDKDATTILGNDRLFAQALTKLDSYNKALPLDINLAEAPLFTVNPLARFQWCRFAIVQPSVERRVQALTGHPQL